MKFNKIESPMIGKISKILKVKKKKQTQNIRLFNYKLFNFISSFKKNINLKNIIYEIFEICNIINIYT